MLKFFYLLLKKYILDRRFELMELDTDSMYFSISRQSLDDCVPEQLKEAYFKDKLIWMPAEACPSHTKDYILKKITGENWTASKYCSDFNQFEQRTLGKMKKKFSGSQQICLAFKSYFC